MRHDISLNTNYLVYSSQSSSTEFDKLVDNADTTMDSSDLSSNASDTAINDQVYRELTWEHSKYKSNPH